MVKFGSVILWMASWIFFGVVAFASGESSGKYQNSEIKGTDAIRRIDEKHFTLSIFTPKEEGVQAAAYVNANELPQVINLLLQDPSSDLSKAKREIEEKECPGVPSQEVGVECGRVQFTSAVQTSFGRGGWMDGAGIWTFFVGFRENGTGHFFDAQYGVEMSETVSAQVDKDGVYTGELVKEYGLKRIFSYGSKQLSYVAP